MSQAEVALTEENRSSIQAALKQPCFSISENNLSLVMH